MHPNFINCENTKQAFYLNIYNFLVLYQLAVLMISEPEAVALLTNFNMWQSFLQSIQVVIGGVKMNAYTIQYSILRINLK